MKKKTILILGGYGGVGRSLSHLILKETDVNIIVSGRRQEKAEEFVKILNDECLNGHAAARYADATDSKSLTDAFQGVDMVIVTATTPRYLKQIAQIAVNNGCDYLDILVQQNTVAGLRDLSQDINNAGCLFITQAGFHPGLPAVFIRQAASYFDNYQKAIIGMAMNTRFEKPGSTHEIIHEIGESKTEIFKDGKWRKADYKDAVNIDFGSSLGPKQCYPLQMEEIKPLPGILGLEETGVYVAGFNWFVDNFVFPLIVILQQIRKGMGINFLGKLMHWGVNTFSSPEQKVVFILNAQGSKEDKLIKVKIVAEYEDAYFFYCRPRSCLLKTISKRISKKTGFMFNGEYC